MYFSGMVDQAASCIPSSPGDSRKPLVPNSLQKSAQLRGKNTLGTNDT